MSEAQITESKLFELLGRLYAEVQVLREHIAKIPSSQSKQGQAEETD